MDQRRMDADGGRVVHRGRRANKLAVVVALQNVLVIACMVVTVYVCRNVQIQPPGDQPLRDQAHVYIQFSALSDISESMTLKFPHVIGRNQMGLLDNKEKIYTNCTGPYILHMDLCCLCHGCNPKGATGSLQLHVAERKYPVSSFTVNSSSEVCTGLYSIIYLRQNEKASLHLNSTEGFKIKNVTVGLSYLLGSQCEYW